MDNGGHARVGAAAIMLRVHVCLLQDGESWNRAIRPKAVGAWNLHALSLGLKELEHFVLFSSVVSSMGHQGIRRSCCHDPKAQIRWAHAGDHAHRCSNSVSCQDAKRDCWSLRCCKAQAPDLDMVGGQTRVAYGWCWCSSRAF